jgi:hypothetical protein
MMRFKMIKYLMFIGWVLTSVLPPQALAQQAPSPSDPQAAVQRMCDYLLSLKQFSFRAEAYDDEVFEGGKKLQYGFDMEITVKRPDKIRIQADGDKVNSEFFLNGTTITLFDKMKKAYAVMEVPAGIEEALDRATTEFGLQMALADVASPRLKEHIWRGANRSIYAGLHKVRGVPCHHIAIDKDDAEIQLWIDAGPQPLPRKVLFSMKKLDGSPQWMAFMGDWKTGISADDNFFRFVAPEGARKAKFAPLRKAVGSAKE